MARFDVYAYSGSMLLLDVQADLLSGLNTRVVVPLVPQAAAAKERFPRLKPVIRVNGQDYILLPTDIGALEISALGKRIGNAGDQAHTIVGAIDFLLQGF